MHEQIVSVDGTPIRWLEQLALEMTGYGESIPAGRDRDVSVGAQADRLTAWLDHLGVRQAVLVGREGLGVHYGPYARHGGGAAMARQVAALDVQDTLEVQDALPALRVPARVVWGVNDSFQKLEYGERFARDLGTTVRRIEGGKHFTPEDSPDVIADAISDLLAEVDARA